MHNPKTDSKHARRQSSNSRVVYNSQYITVYNSKKRSQQKIADENLPQLSVNLTNSSSNPSADLNNKLDNNKQIRIKRPDVSNTYTENASFSNHNRANIDLGNGSTSSKQRKTNDKDKISSTTTPMNNQPQNQSKKLRRDGRSVRTKNSSEHDSPASNSLYPKSAANEIQIMKRKQRKIVERVYGQRNTLRNDRIDKTIPKLSKKARRQLNQQVNADKSIPNFNQYKRHPSRYERILFPSNNRDQSCLKPYIKNFVRGLSQIDNPVPPVASTLNQCGSIEHQVLRARDILQQDQLDLRTRYEIISSLLECISSHHGSYYEGLLFGSSVNGLGFKDSDVDLRLRVLKKVSPGVFEPTNLDDDMTILVLRDIAFQTHRCFMPMTGEFVPSARCPLAKLKLYAPDFSEGESPRYKEGIQLDVTLSAGNSLGSFNSMFLRFLCALEPKFHILAMVVRYWSKQQNLIQPGLMSSYALINMLILYCQSTNPPLLPSVDYMRDTQTMLERDTCKHKATTQLKLEWMCTICLDINRYEKSKNEEPLSVLLLKFFQYYIDFPYSTHIISIRTGHAITRQEFNSSPLFDPLFVTNDFINIQDPFDLKHNLTSGLRSQDFFLDFYYKLLQSHKILFEELQNNLFQPKNYSLDWGLSRLFSKLTVPETLSLSSLMTNSKKNANSKKDAEDKKIVSSKPQQQSQKTKK